MEWVVIPLLTCLVALGGMWLLRRSLPDEQKRMETLEKAFLSREMGLESPKTALDVQKRWNRVFVDLMTYALANPSSVSWGEDSSLIVHVGPSKGFEIGRHDADQFMAWITLLERELD